MSKHDKMLSIYKFNVVLFWHNKQMVKIYQNIYITHVYGFSPILNRYITMQQTNIHV